eukprot:CAMPEP_0204841408 /NCGR_PEP_ID=MMETSP1346-20131115/41852_1 /ASSEMBLY_ACC=CAM_ASM_000771 /TAXON_ID=215587 /ORGANISM="Aplanochytrium stocchinoi, Strain GSBS06" /LENGTH=388 /DNA_ID=CAMNT_0051979513 /DNA_START=360 /DNA_END=1526 /DNA_ORIENTATION=-
MTMFLIVGLRFIRVYTAFYVVGDPQLCLQYCVSLFFNGVLLSQIVLMREQTSLVMKRKTTSQKQSTRLETLVTESPDDERKQIQPVVPDEKSTRLPDALAKEVDAMVKNLVKTVDSHKDEWIDALVTPTIHVQRHPSDPYKLHIRALFDGNPDTAFSVMTDIKRRLEWDKTTDEAYVVESYDTQNHVIYTRGKTVWPVSPRDMVLLSTKRRLEDGRLTNVVKSVKHSKVPEGMVSGCVRGEAKTMGTVLSKPSIGFKGFDGSGKVEITSENVESKCVVSQIGHVDPKGNIPGWLVKMVATKFIPKTLESLNEKIKVTPKVEKWSAPSPAVPSEEELAEENLNVAELKSNLQRLQNILRTLALKTKRLERVQYLTMIVLILFILFKAKK